MTIEELIRQETENILKRIGANIEALILVGSFARGEGLTCQNNAELELISDIEFLAIAKPEKLGKLNKIKPKDNNLTLNFSTRKHLKKLKPCIFTLELKNFGKVVRGDKEILKNIPDYEYSDIAPIDGFILLNNRIVEQLILLKKIEDGKTIYQYDIDKGYIQLANSLLAFHKQYKSLYKEKAEALKNTLCDMCYLADKIPDFKPKAENALNNAISGKTRPIDNQEAKEKWLELKKYFREIWLYEASVLLNDLSYNFDKTLDKFIAIPDFKARLKGWIKLMAKGIHFGNMHNIFISSPQFLIYRNAAKLYFSDQINREKADSVIKKWEAIVK
ncbi:MAG: hypothetical protein COV72_02930 [Candidatus Omnitrophica bacterium CG11_big_fil_rev_8_21_14_0_20_42_13]|uniref:Uncharacterized protein n=1 Tax=Candidatus Ghiorseimicrobium undicola TaxID=1974746 RepID=A0A2H0LYL6_9BACT|nr:MAG: hypothetical protein COV72_02930 [Candidatus Omnitrophica bacterium CG11_big_fil_rev_8_21_14_0_20_42_13]